MPETPDLTEYEWPTCVACGHDLWEDETERWACRPCEERTRTRLGELPALFARLNTTAALMRGARRTGSSTSGSRVPPIPPRIEVLDLVAAGGVATRLQAIEDSWREALGRRILPATDGVRLFASWRTYPAHAVPGHVEFLVINLQKACGEYESVGQDIDDIRKLVAECKSALNPDRKPGKVKIGVCPAILDEATGLRCAQQLTASTGSFKTQCPNCQAAWEGEQEWRELQQFQRQAVENPAGSALESAVA